MKPQSSIAPATWMLDHFTPGSSNEGLAGDLLEEFHAGRSEAWYWRQVISALVVGVAAKHRAYRMPLAFSAGWSVLYPMVWASTMRMGAARTLWQRVEAHDWPYSTGLQAIGEMTPAVLFMWLGFLVYLMMSKPLISQIVTLRSLGGLSISLNVSLVLLIGQHMGHAGVDGRNLSQQNYSSHLVALSLPLAVSLFAGLMCLVPQRQWRLHSAGSFTA